MIIPKSYNGQIIAEHETKPNIKVFCVLDVIKVLTDSNSLVALVGVREKGDTYLPLGARIFLKSFSKETEPTGDLGKMAVVKEVKRQKGKKLHYLQIDESEQPVYKRQDIRVDVELPCSKGSRVQFKTTNLSVNGAQFVYDSTLTSAVLYQVSQISINFDGENQVFDCEVRYILYNWWNMEHRVGVQFLEKDEKRQQILESVINPLLSDAGSVQIDNKPELTPESEPSVLDDTEVHEVIEEESIEERGPKKTMIDPESGRIRFDN